MIGLFEVMVKNFHELIQITRILVKRVCWKSLLLCSFLWCVISYIFSVGYISLDEINVALLFSSTIANSIIHILLYYLSYAIPMVFTILFLTHPMREEYYYSRITCNAHLLLAKLLIIFTITWSYIISCLIFLTFLFSVTLCTAEDYCSSSGMIQGTASLLLSRLAVVLFPSAVKEAGFGYYPGFILSTFLIFCCVTIQNLFFSGSLKDGSHEWIHPVLYVIDIILIIAFLFYRNLNGDILPQEDSANNGQ